MEEAIIKRILPHSIEAEQSVIGSMIMDRDAIVVASEILTDEDFYQKQYGVLFDTMLELNNEGKPVDLVTLQDKLKEKNVPPELCSIEFIRGLITVVPTSANVGYRTQRGRLFMNSSAPYQTLKYFSASGSFSMNSFFASSLNIKLSLSIR